MKTRTIQILLQAGFWLVIGTNYMNYLLRDFALLDALGTTIFAMCIYAVPFYLNYFFISDYLFIKKQYVRFSLLILLVLSIPVLIINFTDYAWLLVDESSYDYNIDGISNFIFFLLISTAIKGMEIWLNNQQREAQREKEKLQAELNFLKLQINPHFLFNTLNNIYSLAYSGNPKSADMIAKLSQILRYMLYDCKEERVALQKEIDLLENYINLQILKFAEERNIDLYTEGINLDHKVAPLLLINFLENSFKHSDISTNEKGWIKIAAIVENDVLEFTLANSLPRQQNAASENSGLGLANIQKQLTLTYPENHQLEIEKNDHEFQVTLKINLN